MPRNKASLSAHKRAPAKAVDAQDSSRNGTCLRRSAGERLASTVLEELWSIWRTDPRIPSVKSRRLWAMSRNANPRLVDSWFLRRKTCAKKAGQPVPDDLYHLSSELVPKREESTTLVEQELEPTPDLPSGDTLFYPPDVDYSIDVDASSDTVFDEDATLALPKRAKTPAYKEIQCFEYHHSQLKLSSADLYAAEDHYNLSPENDLLLVCSQGQGGPFDFTCVLCSSKSVQGTPDVIKTVVYLGGSLSNLRLDFSPFMLSELSAIPFLFRTPATIYPDNAVSCQHVGDWVAVEDELGRLVNGGRLDFSFLDIPDLAYMELIG